MKHLLDFLHTKFTGIVSRKIGIVSNVREMIDEEDFWKAQNIKAT
jgi:hypothetical protein